MEVKLVRAFLIWVLLAFPQLVLAATQHTTMVYRLSAHISLTVALEDRDNSPYVTFTLDDDRPDGIKNYLFDYIGLGETARIEHLEILKPDFVTQDPDSSLQFEEQGDLVRNLKKAGNFVFRLTYRDYTGAIKNETFIYFLKRIIENQPMGRVVLRDLPPLAKGEKRFISARKINLKLETESLISIVDVKNDGSYHYQIIRGDSNRAFYNVMGSDFDLYSLPDFWMQGPDDKLYLGGTERMELKGAMRTRFYKEDAHAGQGIFPSFPYSLGHLGTRNLVPGLDQTQRQPHILTVTDDNGKTYQMKADSGMSHSILEKTQPSEEVQIAQAQTEYNDLMIRLSSEQLNSVTPETKSDYQALMTRLKVSAMSCKRLFE